MPDAFSFCASACEFGPGFRRLVRIEAGFLERVLVVVEHRRRAVERHRDQVAGLRVAVIAGDGRHERLFVERHAGLLEHVRDRDHGLLGLDHRGRADFVDLQDRRRVAAAIRGDAGGERLVVGALEDRHDLVVALRRVEVVGDVVQTFAERGFHARARTGFQWRPGPGSRQRRIQRQWKRR